MNRTATLIATLAIVGLSACTPQQRQIVDQIINDPAPAVTTVTCDPAISKGCQPTATYSDPVTGPTNNPAAVDPAIEGGCDPAVGTDDCN